MKVESGYYYSPYRVQDRCLGRVFAEPFGFYIGGGTALSRFYLEHRFSDDLHLFPEYFRRPSLPRCFVRFRLRYVADRLSLRSQRNCRQVE